jgi:hypothetical protein
MLNSTLRAAAVAIGAAFVIAAVVGPAWASDSLFPSSMFTLASAPQLNSDQSGFFSNAMNTVTSGNYGSGLLSGGLFSVQDPYAVQPPALQDASQDSGSSITMLSPQINDNPANNVALGQYNSVISEFPNQTNLFAPYTFSS